MTFTYADLCIWTLSLSCSWAVLLESYIKCCLLLYSSNRAASLCSQMPSPNIHQGTYDTVVQLLI
jgi:hypothetical protein